MNQFEQVLKESNAGAFLITNLVNIRYLTGFTGSNALMAVLPDRTLFWTDPRYALQAAPLKPRIARKPLIVAAKEYLNRCRITRVAFERHHLRFDEFEVLSKGITLQPVTGAVERLRAVKSPDEIAKIRTSVNTNSATFERALKSVKPGMTERDLAAEIDYRMRRLGAECTAFDTIVAAGLNGALPHAHPGNRKLENPQLVLVDMGAKQDGYTSDMSRMFHLGRPSKETRERYRAVLEAQMSAINAVKPGVKAAQIDAAARAVLEKFGLADKFVHSTGHGLGLEIHEDPRIGKRAKSKMQAGMVVTIEPGIYIEGWGGIRIEDTIVVTDTGCEILTPTSKELRII